MEAGRSHVRRDVQARQMQGMRAMVQARQMQGMRAMVQGAYMSDRTGRWLLMKPNTPCALTK